MNTMATFTAAVLPIVGALGILLLITEGILPCISRWWHSHDNKRQIVKLVSKSRNY